MIRKLHPLAGAVAFALILTFWTSTVAVELLGDASAIVDVKTAILWGLAALIPAMSAAGATGFRLGGRSTHPIVARKRRRMRVIAANGALVLVPCAIYLQRRASAGLGQLDRHPVRVQLLEVRHSLGVAHREAACCYAPR